MSVYAADGSEWLASDAAGHRDAVWAHDLFHHEDLDEVVSVDMEAADGRVRRFYPRQLSDVDLWVLVPDRRRTITNLLRIARGRRVYRCLAWCELLALMLATLLAPVQRDTLATSATLALSGQHRRDLPTPTGRPAAAPVRPHAPPRTSVSTCPLTGAVLI